jgi:hypothetical protein
MSHWSFGTGPRSRWEAGAQTEKVIWVSDSLDCDPPITCARKNNLAGLLGGQDSGILGKMGTHDGCIRKTDCFGLDWVHREIQEWIIVIWS